MRSRPSQTLTIPRRAVERNGGVVILSLKEYQKLRERAGKSERFSSPERRRGASGASRRRSRATEDAVPEYYLTGRAARELDNLVEEGLRDYEAGRTRKIKSLADLD